MSFIKGVNLLPSTGEFAYDTIAYLGQRITEATPASINRYGFSGAGTTTDYTLAIDQLQAQFPDCETVAIVVAWFASSTDVTACQIYPSTTYINGSFQQASGTSDDWRCSGMTQASAGLIPLPQSSGSSTGSSAPAGSFVYGGTPSDQSVVRCIRDLKARGLRVTFYPFVLMTALGFPWRGRMTYTGSDVSEAATAAINAFFGSATPPQFVRDTVNLTVSYAGSATDYTYRRMILHYANLCVIAGGVDLFLLGSEFRGLETVRGPAWTKAGVTSDDGRASWDYPFVTGLSQLANDVRSVFDTAGFTKDLTGLKNLISYSADWSVWMGYQHPGENGQWPHLDALYAHGNIDLVCFDNYLPLSDWTTGTGGLDVIHWSDPVPKIWPPATVVMNGLGLEGQPTLYNLDYLKANIEGGEKFNWFYADSDNAGIGLDPNGTDLRISLPQGDRLTQTRQPYYANQQLLANKQLRWWWNNTHQAVYDNGDGQGYAPHGPPSQWVAQSKSITFAEYGVAACDRGTNQPNVFFDPKSSESFTPFWSAWEPSAGGSFRPREDAEIQQLYLRAIYEYWISDGNNMISATGIKMVEPTFMSVWNWDARPFPAFPVLTDIWGDAGNWRTGQWLSGKGPYLVPDIPDPVPSPSAVAAFPTLAAQGWSVRFTPVFATTLTEHVSGRSTRSARYSIPSWEIELTFDVLTTALLEDLQTICGFFGKTRGEALAFEFDVPSALGLGGPLLCRFTKDQQDLEEFMTGLFTLQSLKLQSVLA
jgi:hypothetical protein